MQKVLVTGCNGFVGSHICQTLLEKGYLVTGIDSTLYKWNDNFNEASSSKNYQFLEGDITDEAFVAKAVERSGPDTVIHLASVVGVNRYIEDPMKVIDVNILGLRNLVKALRGSRSRILFSSTSEIYGKNPDVPWKEDGDRVLGPTSVSRWAYSTSKAAAEHMLWACAGKYGLKAVVVRYFNLYGPRQRPELLIPAQVQRALAGDDLLVYDGGDQTRCFTYIGDAVSGTLAAAFNPLSPGHIFNIGATTESTIREVTLLIKSMAGGVSKVREIVTGEIYGNAYEDIPRRVPDAGKALKILGWKAETQLEEGLLRTIKWWQTHFKRTR